MPPSKGVYSSVSATPQPKSTRKKSFKFQTLSGCLSQFKRLGEQFRNYWWPWEVFAATISIAATVALIAVLHSVNGHPLQSASFGDAQISINTVVAAITTIIRTSLLVTIAGPLNQSAWNWFSTPGKGNRNRAGRPLKDLDIFGNAARDPWSSIQLLWRTRGMYENFA
jgi:hypothetical protein